MTAFAALLAVACGSGPAAPSPAATIRIGPAGVEPREVRIEHGNYVTFVNADSRPHAIVSASTSIRNVRP
jgi:plastocyanin